MMKPTLYSIKLKVSTQIVVALIMLLVFANPVRAIVLSLPLDYMKQQETTTSMKNMLDSLEKSSHKKGKKFPAVLAIVIDDPSDNMLDLCTGTYFAKIGNSGFVLTSAHLASKAKNKLQFLYLTFGSGYRDVKNRVAAKNIYIHPSYYQESKNLEIDETLNDVAIIEFDASKLPNQITPIPLDDADNYDTSEYLEGIMLGYGPFCTNISTMLDSDTIHFAETNVYLIANKTPVKKQPIFRITLSHISNFYPQIKDAYRFATTYPSSISSTIINDYPAASSFQLILHFDQVHPQQGFLTPGDEGGPLLFRDKNDPNKFKLAGIMQRSGVATDSKIYIEDRENGNHLLNRSFIIWDPIFVHKDWIKKIIAKDKKEL